MRCKRFINYASWSGHTPSKSGRRTQTLLRCRPRGPHPVSTAERRTCMMCVHGSRAPNKKQDKQVLAWILHLNCQCSIQPHPSSGPSSRCVPAPNYKRPEFQMCSCAHQQAARVPDVFLRPPTSGPSSRCVPAPTYKRPVFQRSVPAPTQRGPCPKGVSLFQEPRSLLYQPCSAGNVTQRFCYI